jgi:AraC family transcriptional regulator, regulatory protein of adaptative response / methylphosphotriester-DNA alkyltransferase methyltransferase
VSTSAEVCEAPARGLSPRVRTIDLRTSIYRDAVAIVAAEYAGDLRLDDVARRVASSRRQLQRCFAEIGQTTFRGHLSAVRMQAAAGLLDTTGMPVREIARRVGYSQPAQFAKAFWRHYGVTPSAFRLQLRAAA